MHCDPKYSLSSVTSELLYLMSHFKDRIDLSLVITDFCNISEPGFVPEAAPKGSGLDSFTVGWSMPEEREREFVGRYHLVLQGPVPRDTQERFLPASASDYMFTDLKPATEYTFKVSVYVYREIRTSILISDQEKEHYGFIIFVSHYLF